MVFSTTRTFRTTLAHSMP